MTKAKAPSHTVWDCSELPATTECDISGHVMGVQCAHAGCCAKAAATRGHYAIARTLLHVAKTIDPSTTKEEVATGPDRLRPGDIVTGVAIDGQRVAIDVGVTSQARRTPLDLVYQYAIGKINKYRHLIDGEMRREGLLSKAAVWS